MWSNQKHDEQDNPARSRKSSLGAAIGRSLLADCPLWTGNACKRSLLLYPPTRNSDRFPSKSVRQNAIALIVADDGRCDRI
ncbi:hypothetical protein NDI49_19660 [Trichocoleus sp. ST-U3]